MTDMIPNNDEHIRPDGVSDEVVKSLGKVSEALETIERARGYLYDFHQLIGHADLSLNEAVELLQKAGLADDAAELQRDIVGRNVIPGKWTFQIIEEFNDHYYDVFKTYEAALRAKHVEGRRHLYESEMKEQRRTHGREGHDAR